MSYEFAQIQQQQMAAMQQQEGARREKEGNLEKQARRAIGEEEEGGGDVRYDTRGREYAQPENNRLEREKRREHQGGGRDFKYGGHGKQSYSLNALMALAGITMIILTGMPHLTGGVIGGSASGYINMVGGFLILLAIGLYFVNKNRL